MNVEEILGIFESRAQMASVNIRMAQLELVTIMVELADMGKEHPDDMMERVGKSFHIINESLLSLEETCMRFAKAYERSD